MSDPDTRDEVLKACERDKNSFAKAYHDQLMENNRLHADYWKEYCKTMRLIESGPEGSTYRTL